jgi:hypothetical protein
LRAFEQSFQFRLVNLQAFPGLNQSCSRVKTHRSSSMMKTRAGAGTGRAGRSGYVIGDVTGFFYRMLGVMGWQRAY